MRAQIGTARLYLVAGARVGERPLADLIPDLAGAGVDLVQLREKELEGGDLVRVGLPIAEACAAAGVPFIVNDRADVALAVGADGVHLGRNDLPVEVARRILGGGIVGCSTHSTDDLAEVTTTPGVDYVAVGPVFATPTKPGRPATGLELIRNAAATVTHPWFAIGGIDLSRLPDVMAAGARRIVVVRAITEAGDPIGAAASLRSILDQTSLPV